MINLFYSPTRWTRADILKIHPTDPTTLQPPINNQFPIMDNSVFIWDTMPLRKLDGTVVSINGWSILFTLTSERRPDLYQTPEGEYDIAADWNDRHDNAHICFWYSRTGKNWQLGGSVIPKNISPTIREWAGSAILLNESGEIDLYYTSVMPGATIAKVRGRIITSATDVRMVGFNHVISLFSPDGFYYQTPDQNTQLNFRDPYPFIDPNDGELYMLFEGNVAGQRGSHPITTLDAGPLPEDPKHHQFYPFTEHVGCIGIAKAMDQQGNTWKMMPPILTTVGVNDQTERPHFVFKDNKYYLFTISHQSTYADGLFGPDGLYGFVSKTLFGPYEPLNGSGLVLGEPRTHPYQAYGHLMMPNGLVTSFIDTVPNIKGGYRIGGTEAPTVQIIIEGNRTFIGKVFDYGYIPAMENIIVNNERDCASNF